MLRLTRAASRALPLLVALLLSACGDSPTTRQQPEQPERIAFLLSGESGLQLHLINADGTGLRRIETVGGADRPSWSPDGRRLAFAGGPVTAGRPRDGIYVAGADGSGLTRIVASPSAHSAAWAPDGRIAYVEITDWERYFGVIVSIAADGSGRRVLVSETHDYRDLAWSRDGRKLAFDRAGRVCILTLSSGQVECVATGFSPAWTPDGLVSFAALDQDRRNLDIYLMKPDGTGITRITSDPGADWAMSWAPDGERLVLERSRRITGPELDLWIINRDGTGLRQLTSTAEIALRPAWSPRAR